jgi:D-amino-acid dehydrogenase
LDFMPPERREVLVLGAGVVGMATAYSLARRGHAVTIVDKAPEPGRGTSFANGGQLSYVYTDALGSPALLRKLPGLLAAADPAFRLIPSFDPDFLRWGVAFLRNCTSERFFENTLAGLRLALESRAAMHELLQRHPIGFGHAAPGKLHLYEDAAGRNGAARLVAAKRDAGAHQSMLTPDEAVRVEPALASVVKRLSWVLHSPQEEVGDPYLFCKGMLAALQRDFGVTARFGTTVRRLLLDGPKPVMELDGGERLEPDGVALCTGIDTPALLRGAGIRVPIWPMKGYSFTANPAAEAPQVSITDVTRKLVFCRLSGRIRVAGLADLGNRDRSIDERRLGSLIAATRESLPAAVDYDRIESEWAGLRPMTPNSLPIIRLERPGLVLNVGHGALGWTYAMGAAERAARMLVGDDALSPAERDRAIGSRAAAG